MAASLSYRAWIRRQPFSRPIVRSMMLRAFLHYLDSLKSGGGLSLRRQCWHRKAWSGRRSPMRDLSHMGDASDATFNDMVWPKAAPSLWDFGQSERAVRSTKQAQRSSALMSSTAMPSAQRSKADAGREDSLKAYAARLCPRPVDKRQGRGKPRPPRPCRPSSGRSRRTGCCRHHPRWSSHSPRSG